MIIENPRPEEEKIIKDKRTLFRLKNEISFSALKSVRELFRIEKGN